MRRLDAPLYRQLDNSITRGSKDEFALKFDLPRGKAVRVNLVASGPSHGRSIPYLSCWGGLITFRTSGCRTACSSSRSKGKDVLKFRIWSTILDVNMLRSSYAISMEVNMYLSNKFWYKSLNKYIDFIYYIIDWVLFWYFEINTVESIL